MQASLTAFDEIRHGVIWKRWGELAGGAPPFLTPEFFALSRPFADRGEVLVAGSWGEHRMTGALPLVLEHHTLRAMRNDHSPGYDYLGGTEGIEAIWKCLRDDARWSELVLDKLPQESRLVSELPALARADGCPVVVRSDGRHPYLALADFEARIKPKFLSNLQRCERKAGDLVFERILVPTRDDCDEAAAIEAMAWKAAAGTSIAADPRATHLYQAMSRVFGRRGRASLVFLRVKGRRIATLFELEDSHTLYALKIGYDPQFANLSPGHLLVWKVAADAQSRGLEELDFVGREDEWKLKWTDRVHERVAVVIYRRSARGLVRYALREVVKPRLPETVRETPRSPFPRRCQHADIVGKHTLIARVSGRLDRGLGVKSGLRRVVKRARPQPHLGEASAFAVGSWVRVRDEIAIRSIVDGRSRTRGLAFVPQQWHSCSGVFRVERHVRRLRDDHGRFRPMSRTVLLEGVDCGFGTTEPAGCGRHCPLMYRDEWLEPAVAPHGARHAASKLRHARVRDAADIAAGLDLFGRRDGLTFMPEMAEFSGHRFAIATRLDRVYEYGEWIATRRPIYVLEGLHCRGAICGATGPCDRGCAMMWHEDWLMLEPEQGREGA